MINLNLLSVLFFFFINLLVCTGNRKFLTYKGLQIVLVGCNTLLLMYCTYKWDYYVVKHSIEKIVINVNPNSWHSVQYELNFKINNLSFLFIFLVSIIGFATNIYILNYFKYEERNEEFILLINWFILSMIFLISGNNFFTIILGWELIGLTSFLLINFWKYKITTLSCSFKAFSFNKVSDMLLMLSFCSLWKIYKINSIDVLLYVIKLNPINTQYILLFSGVSLLMCSSIKSAQLFGHLWLPDSMEAPVPASSLIHSATLVSAGIYLLLKFETLYIEINMLKNIFYLGSITACYGGIVAASQSDVKKLLAYSTISHCGFIVAAISLNNFTVTIVYLYLHGLFKAVTFFCVGSLIKYTNTQDMRYMGQLKTQLLNTATLITCSINLGGLPFTFGYLYKNLFLNSLILSNYNFLGFGFCIIGMLCSLIYVYKLIYYSCFDIQKSFLQTTILYLQTKNIISYKLNNFFTIIKLIAFFTIYSYSVIFFIFLKLYILKQYNYSLHLPNTLTNDIKYLSLFTISNEFVIKLFYVFFTVSILILTINSWRTNFFYLFKITILTNLLIFFFALTIINFFLKYLLVLI